MENKIYDKLRRHDRLQVSRRMLKKNLQSTSTIEVEGENIDSIFDILPNNSIVTIVTKLGYCDFEVVLNDNYIIACHQKIITKFEYFILSYKKLSCLTKENNNILEVKRMFIFNQTKNVTSTKQNESFKMFFV